jgi:glucose/arabinose dehydrogenase
MLTGFANGHFATVRAAVPRLKIGRHTVDTIVAGPDARIYVGVGSVADNRGSPGHVFSFRPGGAGLRVEAGGLRNPFGLAFVPGTRRLLVTDNARDDLGPFRPPEELDAFDIGAPVPDFGFPGCYDQGGSRCAGSVAPIATFAAHASSDGLAITKHWGTRGLTAFVAENGSSFAANPSGSDVRIVRLGKGGRTASQRRFASGFASHDPLGAAIGPDGALYVTLFGSGKVLRFSPP